MSDHPTEPPTSRVSPSVPTEITISVEEGTAPGTVFRVTTFPVVLGRSPQSDVTLPDDLQHPTISRQHARLHLRGGRLYIEDISSTGTRVGDRELAPREATPVDDQAVWLGPRTRLRISHSLGEAAPPLAPPFTGRPSLQVRSLGGFVVETGGATLSESVWETRKGALLLALLVDSQVPVAAETLAERLWPDSADGGKTALQTTVSRIRKAFKGVASIDPIQLVRGSYGLSDAYQVEYDVSRFESLCDTGRQAIEGLENALALYRGPYLEGYTADWIDVRRTILSNRYSEAVHRLGLWHEGAGRLEEAQRVFERLLRHDPCAELGRQGVMRCLAGLGRREEAIRQYHDAVRILEKVLQVGPSPALTALYERIMYGSRTS